MDYFLVLWLSLAFVKRGFWMFFCSPRLDGWMLIRLQRKWGVCGRTLSLLPGILGSRLCQRWDISHEGLGWHWFMICLSATFYFGLFHLNSLILLFLSSCRMTQFLVQKVLWKSSEFIKPCLKHISFTLASGTKFSCTKFNCSVLDKYSFSSVVVRINSHSLKTVFDIFTDFSECFLNPGVL